MDNQPLRKILGDVPVGIKVEIGMKRLSPRELLGLRAGSIISGGKMVGEPMDVIIAGRLAARGEVVVVNNRYGLRISEVVPRNEA